LEDGLISKEIFQQRAALLQSNTVERQLKVRQLKHTSR